MFSQIKFLLISIFFFVINSFAEESLPPDILRIQQRGKIVVAMYNEDVPPFFMKDANDKFIGIDVKIAQDIAKKLEVKLEFNRNALTFEDVVDLVANNNADIAVSMLSATLKRSQKIRFTEPYVVLHQSLLINRLELAQKKKSDDILNLLNSEGSKIGIVEGTSYVEFLKEDFPYATHILYKSWNKVVEDVQAGKILALLYDEIEIQNWQHDNPKSGLFLQTIIRKDKPDPLGIGVNWKDNHLHYWLNQYLKSIELDGTLSKLKKYYIEKNEWRQQLKQN